MFRKHETYKNVEQQLIFIVHCHFVYNVCVKICEKESNIYVKKIYAF